MSEMLFSIIVPIYNITYDNGKNLFSRCMRSLLDQTYKNIEVLLIDDGSTDDALAQCNAFAKTDSRVLVIQKENSGAGAARNVGVRHSQGDYIFFVDADDEIELDSCMIFADILTKHPNLDIIGSDAVIRKNRRLVYIKYTSITEPVTGAEFLKIQLTKRTIYAATCKPIIKREFWLANNLFFREDIRINEDCEWTPRLFLPAKSVITSNYTHYIYYKRDVSRSNPAGSSARFADIIKYCYELEERFTSLQERELREIMLAYIIPLWFGAIRKGRFIGKQYDYLIRKGFLHGKARTTKEKIWVFLYHTNPYLYYYISRFYYFLLRATD